MVLIPMMNIDLNLLNIFYVLVFKEQKDNLYDTLSIVQTIVDRYISL